MKFLEAKNIHSEDSFVLNMPFSGENIDHSPMNITPKSRQLCGYSICHGITSSFEKFLAKTSNPQQFDELNYFGQFLGVLGLWPTKGQIYAASLAVGLFFIVLIPFFSLRFIQPVDNATEHQLPFRILVFLIELSLALISFLFLHLTVYQKGLVGILYQKEDFLISSKKSYFIICGALLLGISGHLVLKSFLFYNVPLKVEIHSPISLPLLHAMLILDTLAWIYKVTTFLWCCIIFWKVCKLQVIQILRFIDLVGNESAPSECFIEYQRIHGIQNRISKVFRLFLFLVGVVTVIGILASLYETLLYRESKVSLYSVSTVFLVDLVAIFGFGVCLRAASKISHLHKKVIHAAALKHAKLTMADRGDDSAVARDEWRQRAALVVYLSSCKAGISVYGFVLDRTFVHTTLGALLTTMWFLVGRSLNSSVSLSSILGF